MTKSILLDPVCHSQTQKSAAFSGNSLARLMPQKENQIDSLGNMLVVENQIDSLGNMLAVENQIDLLGNMLVVENQIDSLGNMLVVEN